MEACCPVGIRAKGIIYKTNKPQTYRLYSMKLLGFLQFVSWTPIDRGRGGQSLKKLLDKILR